jgi:hypothetical protein
MLADFIDRVDELPSERAHQLARLVLGHIKKTKTHSNQTEFDL